MAELDPAAILERLRADYREGLARRPAEDPGARRAFVVCRLGGERWALPARVCRHVLRTPDLIPLPGGPPPLRGVLNFRGEVLSVLEIGPTLGISVCPDSRPRVLVLHLGALLGVLMDGVDEVVEVPLDRISPASGGEEGAAGGVRAGVARLEGEPMTLLDPERLVQALLGVAQPKG